ncbi:MAG: bifunctional diguanylate cyclase/phosphodiesterase [Actinomycetota bacterium]
MSRPVILQRRIGLLAVAPLVLTALALTTVAAVAFVDDAPTLAWAAVVAATVVVLAGTLIARSASRAIRDSFATLDRKARASITGVRDEAEPVVVGELLPVAQTLDDLAEQQRVAIAQAEAITAGSFDSPILASIAPGPLGPFLQDSVRGLRDANERVRDSEAFTASILDTVNDAIVVLDGSGGLIASNATADAALELFDGELDAAIPGWHDLGIGAHELSRPMHDGSLMLTELTTTRMMTGGGAITILCWRDLSGERAVQAQISHVAQTDIVTGLSNRQGLLAAHDRMRELGRCVGVIHLDLAEFGEINQRHGFDEGDHVLQIISGRLRNVIRDDDTVARTSGDEFVLLLDSQVDVVDSLARRILDRVAEPIELRDGSTVSIAAHAGWATGMADESYELLRRASYALATAKEAPGTVSSYSAEIAQRDANRRQWEQQLRRAIEDDEFVLFAQPIVDVFERRVLGVEVYLRWQHPSGRLIGPAEFIEIANESDLINDIDRWVIRTTIAIAADADPAVIFSLNVSNRFMANPTMSEFVTASLAEHALPAGRIQVDVTETNVTADAAGVIESIRQLNQLGVKVALDDFGTGYSSLAHLLKLAVSTIKIDRRMVSMVTEPEGRGVVAAILAFAKKRKLHVVAEGVESEEEVTVLAELGCRFQQGYRHAHPAPIHDILAALDRIPFRTSTGSAG